MEAGIIQICSSEMMGNSKESNPFLFHMFAFGYDAWTATENARNEELLRTVGMDLERLRTMSMSELEAWVETQKKNPEVSDKIEELMANNPGLQARTIKQMEQIEQEAVTLLEREDARELYLTPKEVEPWVPLLNQRSQEWMKEHPATSPTEPSMELVFSLCRELALVIFSPERIEKLVEQLRIYRDKQFAAGEREASRIAMGAMHSIERETQPDANRFLISLCYFTLLKVPLPSGPPPSMNEGESEPAK